MSTATIAIAFTVLLAGSWLVFIRLYFSSRRREILAIRKFDETRRKLQDQLTQIDALIHLMAGIHDQGLEGELGGSKDALSALIVESACRITRCPAGSLMLMDKGASELGVVSSKGLSEAAVKSMRLKPGEGIAGQVYESGKMVTILNMDDDLRFQKDREVDAAFKSLVSVPIKIKNRVTGVLSVYSPEAGLSLTDRDFHILQILADQSAVTLENWDLYDNLQKYYVEMIETLARVLEMKENLSHSPDIHSKVRVFARSISHELSLPEAIIKHIEFAALIHGIGKIGIDESILRKPGKLTPEEYEQIKKHPEIGRSMIAQVKFLSPVTSMILYHQERWDGKGYPSGLKGEEIPLGSRIVGIINAFQAMVSDKPYRKALTEKEALDELRKGAGTQFDPKVVAAFIKVLERKNGGARASANGNEDRGRTEQNPESIRK